MNTRNLYYDFSAREFYDPLHDNRRVWGFALPKLETVRLRVAITNGRAILASDGIPLAAYQHSLADKENVIFALKTFENVALEAAGDVTIATSGFDTADAWHLLASGIFAHQTAVPLAVSGGIYYPEFIIFTEADFSDDGESLDSGEYDTTCEVRRRVFTGSEASAPIGSGSAAWYSGTILAGTDNVALTIAGVTVNAKGIPVQTGGTTQALSYVAATNTITIRTTGPVIDPIPVSFKLETL